MKTLRPIVLLLMVIVAVITIMGPPTPLPSKRLAAVPPTDTVLTMMPFQAIKPFGTAKKKKRPSYKGDLGAFMRHLAKIESDNNPRAVNRFGMMGKYQFSPRTLRLMGVTASREEFLSNEELQDSAMVMYMKENRSILRKLIRQYEGTWHRGVYITKSGILAGAHLAGHGGVWAFFDPKNHKYKTSDANGTTVALYMTKFANYKVEF